MSWLQDIEKTGIAPRQHHDDSYEVQNRKVTYSCRLLRDPSTGREAIEVRSQGDDLGWNLWRAIPGERGCSAWSPSWSVVTAHAEASTPRDTQTTTTRRTGSAGGASLGLPNLGGNIPDARFHSKILNREEWWSKPVIGTTGTISSGTNHLRQENVWHPDFNAIISASRGEPEFSSQVVDIFTERPQVNPETGAGFHTGLVTDRITSGTAAAPRPGDYCALNMYHDPGLGGGGLVGYRDDQRGLRALLTLSSRYNGPLVLPNHDSVNVNRYRIGATREGHPVMPMAFTTGALWRGGQGGDGPNLTGPLRGWTDELTEPHQPCALLWEGTHWRIYSRSAIVEVPAAGFNDWVQYNPETGQYDVVPDPREPLPGGGGGGGGGGAPGPAGGGVGGPGGDDGRQDPLFDPNAAAGAGGGDTGGIRNGDGIIGTPFGLNSGQRSGGETQAEVNRRFGGMGFGIPSSGETSRRNRRRSPFGGFGIPGGGGGPGAEGEGRPDDWGNPDFDPWVENGEPPDVDPDDENWVREQYGEDAGDANGNPTREDIDRGRATRGGRWIRRRPKKNSETRRAQDAGEENRSGGETRAGVNARFAFRMGIQDTGRITGVGAPGGPVGHGTGGIRLGGGAGGGLVGAAGVNVDASALAFTGAAGVLVGSGATAATRQIAAATVGFTGIEIIAQATNAGELSTRGSVSQELLVNVVDAPVTANLVGYASGSGTWGGFDYGTSACPTVSTRTRGGQRGQPVALDGGAAFMAPGTTLDQISGGETLSSISGNPVYMLFPQDVSAIAFGGLKIGEDAVSTDAVGGIVSGTRCYQTANGWAVEPIKADGTIADVYYSFTETGLIIHGENGKLTLEGLIDPKGIVFSEQASDPMTGSQVGLYAGNTAGSNEPWWRRDDGTIVNLLTGGGGGGGDHDVSDAATNTSVEAVAVSHQTSGTAAGGFGVYINFELENSDADLNIQAGRVDAAWNVAGPAGSEDSTLTLSATTAGSNIEMVELVGQSGFVRATTGDVQTGWIGGLISVFPTASTNAIKTTDISVVQTSGTAAAGLGARWLVQIENAGGSDHNAGAIDWSWLDATATSEDSEIALYRYAAGSETPAIKFNTLVNLYDSADSTKVATLSMASITTGNTRAFVFPDEAGTFALRRLTTKGDVLAYSTLPTRLAVGANGQVLTADSTQATGLKWAAVSTASVSPLTTKGDLWGYTTVDARVAVGSDGQFLKADSSASAGVSWDTPSTYFFEDQMLNVSAGIDNQIGDHGWENFASVSGGDTQPATEAGHPGILSIEGGGGGAGASDYTAIERDYTGNWVLSTNGSANTIEVEWLIKMKTSIDSTDLEMVTLGLGAGFHAAGLPPNGIFVQFAPGTDSHFRAASVNSSSSSFQAGTTVVAVDTWYRVSVVYTDTGSGGSLQLKVNGTNEGSAVTTNIPTVSLVLFAKLDGYDNSGGGGTGRPDLWIDRVRVMHTPNEED